MTSGRIVGLLALLFLLECGTAPRPAPRPAGGRAVEGIAPWRMGTPDVVLLVTGGTDGVFEPCNCGRAMPGGLSRRAALLRRYRAAFRRTVLIDTGDLLKAEDPDAPRNRFLLEAYRLLGYDALALGDQEWEVEPRALAALAARKDTAFLSSDVAPARGPALRLVAEVKRRWRGIRLAVVSDLPVETFFMLPESRRATLRRRADEALRARVDALKKTGHVVVVVSHGVGLLWHATAHACDADLVLPGGTGATALQLDEVAGKPAARVGPGTVGVFALKIEAGRIARVEYRAEEVDDRWPAEDDLLRLYHAYRKSALRHALATRRKGKLAFVGSAVCGECHGAQYENWRKTAHAHAWQTLIDAKATDDPDCIRCHSTGFGLTEGFLDLQRTPELANVNCQDCHAFGVEEHQRDGFVFPARDESRCRVCHTKVTDPQFAYAARLPTVACPHD